MSEQQIKIGNEWRKVFGITPAADRAGRIGVLHEYEDSWNIAVIKRDEMESLIRPAPATEGDDGWEVKFQASVGLWYVHRLFQGIKPQYLKNDESVTEYAFERGTDFYSQSAALAALAKWREANRTFTPTPHEPCEGVELRSAYRHGISVAPSIYVDDEVADWE